MQITTHSADETQALGIKLAKRLQPGDVIAYFGDLGAGKTALTRGIAQGLGITDIVTSPTYTIVNEYLTGRLPLFHFDMYRLGSSDELFDIGWEDYLARGGVCAVEWSENVEDALQGAIRVTIEKDPFEADTRRITIAFSYQTSTLKRSQSRISFPTRSTNEISQRLILQMLPQISIHIRSIQ